MDVIYKRCKSTSAANVLVSLRCRLMKLLGSGNWEKQNSVKLARTSCKEDVVLIIKIEFMVSGLSMLESFLKLCKVFCWPNIAQQI